MSAPPEVLAASADLAPAFNAAAHGQKPPRKSSPPFSLRLTASERAYLEEAAGNQPLGAFIRARLFGEQESTRRTSRRPSLDHQKLALVLAELGRSRLSQNINQIAKAANCGTLRVSAGLNADLQSACADIRLLRETLLAALGLKTEGE